MRLHRFFGPFRITEGGTEEIRDPGQVRQIRRVLRLKEGDRLLIADGNGREAEGEVRGTREDAIMVRILRVQDNEREPDRRVLLFASLLKRDRMELVAQKAVEVGVSSLVPVIAARCVKQAVRRDRLEKIMKEAAEQAGRARIPDTRDPVPFSEALGMLEGQALMLDERGEDLELAREISRVSVLAGPEGGWTDEERAQAMHAGARLASLGNLTLRAETAAVIGSYLAAHEHPQ